MKLSTKGRYGLRAVLDLAIQVEGETVALSQIAERQGISLSYLEQLIAKLKKAGIVNGIRGAQGGYILAKPTGDISVGEILRALEGDLNPVDCSEVNNGDSPCSNADSCVTKYVWKRISDSINDVVDGIMLSELVAESKKVQAGQGNNDMSRAKLTCGK
ncbi:MAG TPA: Rrf2 family transcriptional regulator [Mobilitalea sp.]|nr:Rrf2 family transcriptional regulator [Mobilitalea sp.]